MAAYLSAKASMLNLSGKQTGGSMVTLWGGRRGNNGLDPEHEPEGK